MKQTLRTSKRIQTVPASPIRKLVPFATAAKKEGVTVYHLNIGDPDIKTPDSMLEVLRSWNRNPVGYDQSQGNPELIEAFAWYYRKLGFPFIGTANIQTTFGGSEAIFMALLAVADFGDEVIVFEPLYANYNSFAATSGVTLVPIATSIGSGFHLPDRKAIESKITPKTKAMLICNPGNPTGTVYTKAEVDMLVDIAKTHGLYLLADEVYREFVYDNRAHVSVLSYMESYPEGIILLDSVSKRYSLCGARVGMLVSLNMDVMGGALRIAQGRLSGGIIDQTMTAQLTKVSDSYFADVNEEYEARRDVLYKGLQTIPGVTVPKPEGAFYAIVGLPVTNAEDFCKWLLTDYRDNNETIMIAPAAGFYATPGLGTNEVRMAYVINQPSLQRSIEILANALKAYSSNR